MEMRTLWDFTLSFLCVAAAAKSLQSCPTLCDPIDSRPPGSPVPGILQARTLEWVAISFSNARKWKVKVRLLSCVWLLATPWTAAYQAPSSMGFTRQEYWSGCLLLNFELHMLGASLCTGDSEGLISVLLGRVIISEPCGCSVGSRVLAKSSSKDAVFPADASGGVVIS